MLISNEFMFRVPHLNVRDQNTKLGRDRAKTPPLSTFLLSNEPQTIFLPLPLNPRTLQIQDPEQAEGKFTLSTHTFLNQSTETTVEGSNGPTPWIPLRPYF
jgi:hypothetical protein